MATEGSIGCMVRKDRTLGPRGPKATAVQPTDSLLKVMPPVDMNAGSWILSQTSPIMKVVLGP